MSSGENLSVFVMMLLRDAKNVESTLVTPVILYDPPPATEEEPDTEARYRYKTMSGVANVTREPGEPVVFQVAKTKDNAFQRGITVGRTGNNDLVLEDASVSRFHAWFQNEPQKNEWFVVDAGSKNGTWVEGVRMAPKKPMSLRGPTLLKFGQVEVRFLPRDDFLQMLRGRLSS